MYNHALKLTAAVRASLSICDFTVASAAAYGQR